MSDRARAAGLAISVLLLLPATAFSAPTTTVQRTFQDCDDDNLLDLAFGERHLVFPASPEQEDQDPCEERPDGEEPRLPPRASILNFLQLSDFQMVDEESPGRVEFLDGTQRIKRAQPFSAAYRPQESLTTQITEAMVRQARNTTSPVTGRPLDLAILTGDNADSQQYNETRWFVDILDGTTGSGNPDPEAEPPDEPGQDRKIHPDSGIPTTAAGCEATPGTRYDGVRDSGKRPLPPPSPGGPQLDGGYYDPDTSNDPRADGDGYLPDRAENEQETGSDVTVRDFPGLFEHAQDPFEAVGLGLPWYSAFGNHDALVQGNSPDAYGAPPSGVSPPNYGPMSDSGEQFNPFYELLATGCAKVKQPVPGSFFEDDQGQSIPDQIADLLQENPPNQTEIDRLGRELERQIQTLRNGDLAVDVPPDRRRCYLAKDDNAGDPGLPPYPCSTGSWIRQHFRTTGTPIGHGFAPSRRSDCLKYGSDRQSCEQAVPESGAQLGRPQEAVLNHDGYYSFVPKPGLRFVVLDTITDECGSPFCSEGSVDEDQFEWLRQQIGFAASHGEYVVAFSHHTLRTIRFPTIDGSEEPVHYGERFDRRGSQPTNAGRGETLEELFCESPNLLAHVAGHEHANYVDRHDCADNQDPPSCFDGEGQPMSCIRCTDPQEPDVQVPCANTHFWHVSTAAHIDWPQQSRMIELVNMGGKMSFVVTMLDHDGPANPGGPRPPREEQGQAGNSVLRLASIGREIAYNDYQNDRDGARGGRQDRNVILPTERPPPPYVPAP